MTSTTTLIGGQPTYPSHDGHGLGDGRRGIDVESAIRSAEGGNAWILGCAAHELEVSERPALIRKRHLEDLVGDGHWPGFETQRHGVLPAAAGRQPGGDDGTGRILRADDGDDNARQSDDTQRKDAQDRPPQAHG